MATRIPSVKSAPDDGLDVMKAVHPPHSTEDDGLKDERALRVPATFDDPDPEARQGLQEPSGPAAIREVVEQEPAGRNPKVEPLPLGVLANTDPSIKVGAIILVNGVTVDSAKPTIGIRQPLQLRILRTQLCIRAVARHKVSAHMLLRNESQRKIDRVTTDRVTSTHRRTAVSTQRSFSRRERTSRERTSRRASHAAALPAGSSRNRGTTESRTPHPTGHPTPRSGCHARG